MRLPRLLAVLEAFLISTLVHHTRIPSIIKILILKLNRIDTTQTLPLQIVLTLEAMTDSHPNTSTLALVKICSYSRMKNTLLQQRILVLEAEKATLQTNFNSLLSSISMSKPPPPAALSSSPRECPMSSSSAVPNVLPPPPFVVYTEKEVPNTTFWQQKLWNNKIDKDLGCEATPGNPLATKNSLHFITDEDGAYPTRERITEARAICASFYFGLKKAGSLPDTWTQVTIADKQIFRATIESEIPELRYCAGHWKVDRLGRITYSSWSGTHNPKGSRVKTEPVSDVEMVAGSDNSDDSDEETGSKRKTNSRAQTHPPLAKKLKSKASHSTSAASAPDRKGKAKVVQGQCPKNPLSLSYDFAKFSGYTQRVLREVLGTYPKLMCFTSTALRRPQGEFRQGFSPIRPSIELGRSSPQFGGGRDSLLSGTLRNIESLDSPLALFLFYGAAAPLFLLRNLAAPAALARAPRLAALRHCAAPLPPHPRFVWSPLPRLGPAPPCRRFARTLRPPFVSTPRFAPVPRTHHTSPPRALRFRTRALGQCTPPPPPVRPPRLPSPSRLALRASPAPHVLAPRFALAPGPSRSCTVSPPRPTLVPAPHPRAMHRFAPHPHATAHRFAPRPRARPRARAPPSRTASLSRLASPPSRTLAPTRPAPRISPRARAPHLASHPCPALPQRLASHPRARPAAHPHPASPSPPPPRSRTPLRFTTSPHSRSPSRPLCAHAPPHFTTPAHSPAPAPLIPTLRFLRSRSGSGSRTTTTLRTHLPSRASALRPNREQRLWDQ
ncbi:hypothetical protein B0H14DRAFT_3170628 [Mycena olivaceomarginata]|nr:hypothetical protein B0H14DRAFT_3170628 [Mycena olivaceomarginata]